MKKHNKATLNNNIVTDSTYTHKYEYMKCTVTTLMVYLSKPSKRCPPFPLTCHCLGFAVEKEGQTTVSQ